MTDAEEETITRVAALCRETRDLLGPAGPFRLRVALEVAAITCAQEQERLGRLRPPESEQS